MCDENTTEFCEWDQYTSKDKMILSEWYETSCGKTYNTAYPIDRDGFIYCPFCGKHINVNDMRG